MAKKNHELGKDSGIIINVDDYVDYLYIHYKTQTASHLASYAQTVFQNKKDEALKNVKGQATEDQLQAMLNSMNTNTPAAVSVGKILDNMQNGSLLEQTLDSLAEYMNNSILNAYNNFDYSKTVSRVHKNYNSLLTKKKNDNINKSMGAENAQNFFNEIEEALKLVNESMTAEEKSSFEALKKVFANGSGWSDNLVPTSKKAVTTASRVINLLNESAKKLSQNGGLSQGSFPSTITQIFSTVIGEELAEQMIDTVMNDILKVSNNAIVNGLTKIPGGKVTTKLTGTDYWVDENQQKRTSKVDVSTSKIFQLAAQLLGGNVLNIDIATNFSVKWQQKKSREIHLVGGTRLTTLFNKMGLDDNAKHAAYNVITHRHTPNWLQGSAIKKNGDLSSAYRAIKSSVAGCFFTEWLTGSGNVLNSGGIDKAQFLMYNGKIYSVLTIIKKICDKMEKNESTVGMDIVGTSKIDNSFIGEEVTKENMSTYWANERSKRVRKVINALTIAGTLNKNVLLQI